LLFGSNGDEGGGAFALLYSGIGVRCIGELGAGGGIPGVLGIGIGDTGIFSGNRIS
jgi:hypothetical protein